jgi:arylsulfatase
MTDNGSAGNGSTKVWNAGMKGGKCSRYDGGHRVPCFIRWPAGGLRPPRDITYATQVQDILPTLIGLCNLAAPAGARFDGIDLTALLTGRHQSAPDRMLVVQYYQNSLTENDAAVIWNRWRLVYGKELYDIGTDPAQQHDLSAEHPDVVDSMRAHYDQWWEGVESTRNAFSPLHVGAPDHDSVRLTCCEWQDVRCDGAESVRQGSTRGGARGGPWNVQFERSGQYEVELRRWPREAGAGLADGVPEFHSREGLLCEGKAMPIGAAQLQVAGESTGTDAQPGAQAVRLNVPLQAGRTQLHAWFTTADGEDVCGAYYAYVRRLG